MRLAFLFGPVALFATVRVFLPNRMLSRPQVAKYIGTENPLAARLIGLQVAIFTWAFTGAGILDLVKSV